MHLVVAGVHVPVHAPLTHALFMHVVTGVSVTRSTPHWITLASTHTCWLDCAPTQSVTMGWQLPTVLPARVSQLPPSPQTTGNAVQVPALQRRPLHEARPPPRNAVPMMTASAARPFVIPTSRLDSP